MFLPCFGHIFFIEVANENGMSCPNFRYQTKLSKLSIILGYLSSFIHHLSPLSPKKIVIFLSFKPLDPRPRMAAAAGFRRVAVLDPRH